MSFFDVSQEDIQRAALLGARIEFLSRYQKCETGCNTAIKLVRDFDEALSQCHTDFLDEVTLDDLRSLSPRLENKDCESLSRIFENINSNRHYLHSRKRIGYVNSELGVILWRIHKSINLKTIRKVFTGGNSFQIDLCHLDDIA